MTKFQDLNLSAPLLRAITELGYESTTPIQAETLPLLLAGDTDFLGLAATGTGKTAAFGIPLLERIQPEVRGVQALILCPTRELAIQVAGQIDLLGKYLGVRSLPVYGGTGYGDQIYGLKNGATIVVGTPGRVVDHIEKGTLRLDQLQTLVLDEADEMISMGFKEDLEAVLSAAPKEQANIWLFSATMGHDVKHVADAYLTDPKKVQVNQAEMLPDTVEQIFYKLHEYDKPDALCKLIDMADDFYGIVFCQTKALVADLHQFLVGKGYKADCLHGDLDQTARDRVMKAFRDHKFQILIATDVACRGLDVKDITHVVNYSIPRELDNYVHRIGRTARSGKKGLALSFVTYSHRELIGRIERMTRTRMVEGKIPTAREIAQKRVEKVRAAFEERGPQGRAAAMIPAEWKAALAGMSPEDVASRFLNMLMPDLFASAGDAAPERLDDSRPKQAERSASAPAHRAHAVRHAQPEEARPRHHGPRPKEKYGDKKRFSSPRPFTRAPREESAAPEGEFESFKPRWKKDRSASRAYDGSQREAASRPTFPKPAASSPSHGAGAGKPKKKYGHWKSKKPSAGAHR